jgi:hypothetical protein
VTLENLLIEIAERGWFVNNLFQISDGSWQANLRTLDDRFTDFGRGDTPAEALSLAIDLIETAQVHAARNTISYTLEGPRQSLTNLLKLPITEPIKRRAL